MSYASDECVVCGRKVPLFENHKCTAAAIRRYEKKMSAIEREEVEERDRLAEGFKLLNLSEK